MPLPTELQQVLIERRAAEERAARANTRREYLATLALLVFWVLVGMVWIGFALHSTDEAMSWIYWWTGWLLWVGGVLWTLHRAYVRGVERGDWS
jgi:hypothetical protein